MDTLHLTIVSQEKKLIDTQIDQITVPTTQGEITILPEHIPLFSKMVTGEVRYLANNQEHSLVVSDGFLHKATNESVVIMVDSAVLAREISVQKAEEAIQQARQVLKNSEDRRELILAEASLRKAMMEIKVARKRDN